MICRTFCQQFWRYESEVHTEHKRQHIYPSGQSLMVHLHTEEITSLWGKGQAQVKAFRLEKYKLKTLTNFGLNIGEDIAYVEGKLLSKGSVFGNGDSIARIIKLLLYTCLKVTEMKTPCSFLLNCQIECDIKKKRPVKNVRYSQRGRWSV